MVTFSVTSMSFITGGYTWLCRWVTIAALPSICASYILWHIWIWVDEQKWNFPVIVGCWQCYFLYESFDWHLPSCGLWPGRGLPDTHQPVAQYLYCDGKPAVSGTTSQQLSAANYINAGGHCEREKKEWGEWMVVWVWCNSASGCRVITFSIWGSLENPSRCYLLPICLSS